MTMATGSMAAVCAAEVAAVAGGAAWPLARMHSGRGRKSSAHKRRLAAAGADASLHVRPAAQVRTASPTFSGVDAGAQSATALRSVPRRLATSPTSMPLPLPLPCSVCYDGASARRAHATKTAVDGQLDYPCDSLTHAHCAQAAEDRYDTQFASEFGGGGYNRAYIKQVYETFYKDL